MVLFGEALRREMTTESACLVARLQHFRTSYRARPADHVEEDDVGVTCAHAAAVVAAGRLIPHLSGARTWLRLALDSLSSLISARSPRRAHATTARDGAQPVFGSRRTGMISGHRSLSRLAADLDGAADSPASRCDSGMPRPVLASSAADFRLLNSSRCAGDFGRDADPVSAPSKARTLFVHVPHDTRPLRA